MTDKLDVEAIRAKAEQEAHGKRYGIFPSAEDRRLKQHGEEKLALLSALAAKDEAIAREHDLYLTAHRDNMKAATMLMEMKSRAAALEKNNADLRLKLKAWTGALDIKRMEELLNAENDNALNASIIANLRAALSGRTVSCSNCNVAEKERDELRADLKDSERKRRNQFTNMGEVLEAMKSAGFDPGDPTGWGKAAKAMASALNALQAKLAQAKAEALEDAALVCEAIGENPRAEALCAENIRTRALRQSVPASPVKEKP